ncbi:hypothetical protein QR680_016265 [Steinernema hermaphroditum]|uniref:Uncharacterized protein n=1 Tax=Steinernema hermaphroditum TaxID=289476 RepID=A0AA39HBR1_9BILA|nr:hypothetical protein QR680_016265 [Steinernema hermaphroditum]
MVLVLTPSMSPLGVFSYFFFLNAAAATTYPVTFYSGDLNKGPQVFVAPELTVFIAITDDSNDDTSSLISMAVGDGEARLVNSYVSGACGTTTASSQTVVIALNDHLLDESQSQSVVFYVIDKKLEVQVHKEKVSAGQSFEFDPNRELKQSLFQNDNFHINYYVNKHFNFYNKP